MEVNTRIRPDKLILTPPPRTHITDAFISTRFHVKQLTLIAQGTGPPHRSQERRPSAAKRKSIRFHVKPRAATDRHSDVSGRPQSSWAPKLKSELHR